MAKLDELLNDPDFKALSLEDQGLVRQRFFTKNVKLDPDFLALPEADQAAIKTRALSISGPSVLGRLARAVIAPIPALAQVKKKAGETAARILGAARPEILAPPTASSPLLQAPAAVRSSLIPLPSPELAKGAIELGLPSSPLDIVGILAGGFLPTVARALRAARAAPVPVAVSQVAETLTMEQLSRRLADAAAKAPKEASIKIESWWTPKEQIAAAVGRTVSTMPPSMPGMHQATAATKILADQSIDRIRSGLGLTRQDGERISTSVARAVATGEIDGSQAARLFGLDIAHGALPSEVAKTILESKILFGRGLAQYSKIAKELSAQFPDEPVLTELAQNTAGVSSWETASGIYRYLDNIRRAAMTAQLATTIRNVISQSGRYGLNIAEDALSGIFGTIAGKMTVTKTVEDVGTDMLALWRSLSKSGRDDITRVLDNFPVEAGRLLGTPVGDIAIGSDKKIATFLNTLNTFQEHYFRRAAFDARLRQTVSRRGGNLFNANTLTDAEVRDAVDHALDLTFAKTPVSGAGRAILGLYREIPVLTALGNPFPRFWLNSLKFIYEFSPAPLFNPATYAAMASSDSRIAYRAISRSTLGAGLVVTGFGLDRMGATGDLWYELKVEDEIIDIRSFAPFSAYLFTGRLMSRALNEGNEAFLKLDGNDWSQALLSMRKADISGIPLLDTMQASDTFRGVDRFKDAMISLVGNWAGGFSVPARTFQDIAGQFMAPERLPRATREAPLTGPFIGNIPFLARRLPVRPSPLRAGPEERESPLLRQLTGLTIRRKTAVETEADRIGIKSLDIYPKTGSREFDRLIIERMGPLLEDSLNAVISSAGYQRAELPQKRALFKTVIAQIRTTAREIEAGARPDLALESFIKRQDEHLQEEMRARLAK